LDLSFAFLVAHFLGHLANFLPLPSTATPQRHAVDIPGIKLLHLVCISCGYIEEEDIDQQHLLYVQTTTKK
jgi:hypothetical protein